MSKIRNGKTEDGKVKWTYFRKPKFKRKSLIRKISFISKMIGVSADTDRRILNKKLKGTLVSKRIEYGKKN